jgi:hypothetical protein
MLNHESVMPNQVLNLIQDLTISASLQDRLGSASNKPTPEIGDPELVSGHGSRRQKRTFLKLSIIQNNPTDTG